MAHNKTLKNLLSKNNRKAWEVFLDEYSKLIFCTISSFATDYDDRMDLFVYVCEALSNKNFKKLRSFKIRKDKQKAKFTTWLVLVVKNLGIDWYRKKEGRIRLSRAIERLPQTDKLIFNYVYLKGNSFSETYEILHTDINSSISIIDFYSSLDRINKALTSFNYEKIAFNLLRKRHKIPFDELQEISRDNIKLVSEFRNHESPDNHFQKKELVNNLKKAIKKLPAQEKLIIKLWFDQGMSAKEIANLIGNTKPHSIYGKIKNILMKLKAQLELQGISYDDFRDVKDRIFIF